MDVIEIERVSKRFGNFTAVDDLSLRVPSGTVQGFLGPNGAGKTTTLRMILNIFAPDHGHIRVFGEAMDDTLKRRIGYLPEERGLYRKMRVVDVLVYFASLKGVRGHEARRRAMDWLERFGLADWSRRSVQDLSKGMRQKVGIIATLVHEPELIILDEPFSGLDPVNLEFVRDQIIEMKSRGHTVIFSTHQMSEAEKLCDRILMIHGGRKVIDGTMRDVRGEVDSLVVLEYDGDGAILSQDRDVARVNDYGRYSELSLAPDADPSALLQRLAARLRVRRFEIRQPTLHEIFVRTVRETEGDASLQAALPATEAREDPA